MTWYVTELENLPTGEILGYDSSWITEDNPNGVRVGVFNNDETFQCAVYYSDCESYSNRNAHNPSHWTFLPDNPISDRDCVIHYYTKN